MNSSCEQNDMDLSLLVDGDLAGPEAAPLLDHLTGCARCRQEKERLEELKAVARRLQTDEAPPALWSRIESRLDEAPAGRAMPRSWKVPVLLAAGLALFVMTREALRETPHPPVTEPTPASTNLRSVDGDDPIAKLAAMLRDPNEDVRASAAESLGLAGPSAKAAVGALVAALKDSSAEVRMLAVRALGGLGPEARIAAGALKDLSSDPDPAVRSAAADALRKLNL